MRWSSMTAPRTAILSFFSCLFWFRWCIEKICAANYLCSVGGWKHMDMGIHVLGYRRAKHLYFFLLRFAFVWVSILRFIYILYQEERQKFKTPQELVETWARVGPPCAGAGLTSAGGFIALRFGNFMGFQQLGVILAGDYTMLDCCIADSTFDGSGEKDHKSRYDWRRLS